MRLLLFASAAASRFFVPLAPAPVPFADGVAARSAPMLSPTLAARSPLPRPERGGRWLSAERAPLALPLLAALASAGAAASRVLAGGRRVAAAAVLSAPPAFSWEDLEEMLPAPAPRPAPLLTLYRDTNGWCPFCARVWLALEQKGIPYDEKLVNLRDKPTWFTDMVPTGLVPAVELHDESYDPEKPGSGELIWESKVILEKLEEKFPVNKLLWDEFAISLAEEVQKAAVAYGYAKPEEREETRTSFESALAMAEVRLASDGPFFSGAHLGIADCMIFPVLERYRYQLPLMFEDGLRLHGNAAYPALERWFDEMDRTQSFSERVAGDEYSWAAVTGVMMRFFGEMTPEKEAAAQRADAAADRLLARAGAVSGATASERARHEAARKVLTNREAIILDATSEPKSQELVPRQASADAVDAALRLAVRGLLEPSAGSTAGARKLKAVSDETAEAARTVAARLSAPRDMGAEAADALRGELARVAGVSHARAGSVEPMLQGRASLAAAKSGSEDFRGSKDRRASKNAKPQSEHRRKIYPQSSNLSPNAAADRQQVRLGRAGESEPIVGGVLRSSKGKAPNGSEDFRSGSDNRASRAKPQSEHRRKNFPQISNISPNYVDNEYTYDDFEQ